MSSPRKGRYQSLRSGTLLVHSCCYRRKLVRVSPQAQPFWKPRQHRLFTRSPSPGTAKHRLFSFPQTLLDGLLRLHTGLEYIAAMQFMDLQYSWINPALLPVFSAGVMASANPRRARRTPLTKTRNANLARRWAGTTLTKQADGTRFGLKPVQRERAASAAFLALLFLALPSFAHASPFDGMI